MVVRLKELQNGQAHDDRKGLVRLKDLQSQEQPQKGLVRLSDLSHHVTPEEQAINDRILMAPLDVVRGIEKTTSRMNETDSAFKRLNAKEDERYRADKYAESATQISPVDAFLDKRAKDNENLPKSAQNVLKNIDWFMYKGPGRFLTGASQGALEATTNLKPEDVGTPTVGGKASHFAGGLIGYGVNPSQLEANLVQGSYGAARNLLNTGAGQRVERGLQNTLSRVNNATGAGLKTSTTDSIASHLLQGGAANALQNVATGAMAGQTSGKEIAQNALIGGGFGGLADAGGSVVGSAFKRFLERNKAIPSELERETQAAFEQAAPTIQSKKALGNLRTVSKDQYVSHIMGQIKEEVNRRMTPPLENPDELAKWLKPHLGQDVSLNEIKKLGYEGMRQLAEDVRSNAKMYDVAVQVAKERGFDLEGAFSGKVPTLKQSVVQDASKRAYGIYDAPKVNLVKTLNPSAGKLPPMGVPKPSEGVTTPNVVESSPTPLKPLKTPLNASEKANDSKGQRSFINTLEQSGKLSSDVAAELKASDARTYEPITNASTVEKANARVAAGVDQAEEYVLGGDKKADAEQIATGMRLIDELQKNGQTSRAVTIAENLAAKLTEAGQTVQAASIWNRLTPEGALLSARRKIRKINAGLKKGQEPVQMTDADANNIMESARTIQSAGASKEQAGQVVDIMTRLKAGQDVSPEELQVVQNFLDDAQQFLKPVKEELPPEFKDVRKRDKILSYLEQQADEARKQWNAKRNIGFAQKLSEPDIVLLAKMGTYHLAKAGIKFADWSEAMVKEFGDVVKPHLQEIYDRSKQIIGVTSKHISEGKLDKAGDAFRRLSGQAAAEKQTVQELATHVQKAVDDIKAGSVDNDTLQKIRDLSEEIAQIPTKGKEISEEQRYLMNVKQLAKKLADVETEKVTPSEATREITSLLRHITEITKAGEGVAAKTPIDNQALNDLAYHLFERTKPSQSEKVALSYLKKNADKLEQDDIELVKDLAQQVSALSGRAHQAASQDLQAVLNGFERAGIGQKLSSAQYIGMLLNPKTQIRNIVGNELMYRLERLQRWVATPIDVIYSGLTGKPRTITMRSGAGWRGFFDPTINYFKGLGIGAKAGWRGVNPEGIASKYDIQGQAFRSKLSPFTYLEKTLGAVMKGFDYAAYNRAVNQRLGEMAYLDALNKGIKGTDNIRAHIANYKANLDDNLHAIADKYGKYVTLQDDTLLSKGLSGFKRFSNKITTGSEHFGAGNLIVPFAKTPANLLMRALDYSPAGVLKAIGQVHTILKRDTDLTRADVIQSVTRALLGTGIGAAAWWLADKGVLFGQNDRDKDIRNLEIQSGRKDFQINGSALQRMMQAIVTGNMKDIDEAAKIQPGDTLWMYEWAQPTSMPMAVGANVHQGMKNQSGIASTAASAAWAGLNTILDSSVLSGIQQALQTNPGSDNTAKSIATNLVKQIPGMFTPTVVRNINQMIDDKVRETYNPDPVESFINPARSNIPGQAQELPQRIDSLGQPMTRENSFFDVFVSPSERHKYQPTPEAQMVIDLFNATGDNRVAPRVVSKYISGKEFGTGLQKKVELTPEQFTRLQEIVGQETAKRIRRINPNLPTDRKVQLVIKALDEAGQVGRNALKKELGLRR